MFALRIETASFFVNLINYRHYERNEVIFYLKGDCHSLQKSKLSNDKRKKDTVDSLLKRPTSRYNFSNKKLLKVKNPHN